MTMKITTRFLRTLLIVGVVVTGLLLVLRDTATGGIQGSGVRFYSIKGRITGFGSIFVEGVEYPTSQARVSINDQLGSESQLRVGQIIHIKGRLNGDGSIGEASEVSYFGDAYGPVTQVDKAAGTFVVLGQTVRVTPDTIFEDSIQPTRLAGLKTGTWVEVSGLRDAAGDLIASYIALKASSATLQVKGLVEALDPVAQTFKINALTVHYGQATPQGVLANGAEVQVRGAAATSSADVLWANHVRVMPSTKNLDTTPGPAAAAFEKGKPRAPAR